MMLGKNFWCGVHALMLVEERANILGKLPVVHFPGGVQRICGLFIGTAYFLPAKCAGCDERRQLILALGDGDGPLVAAAVGLGNLPSPLGCKRCVGPTLRW
jgi:hypothetical protein